MAPGQVSAHSEEIEEAAQQRCVFLGITACFDTHQHVFASQESLCRTETGTVMVPTKLQVEDPIVDERCKAADKIRSKRAEMMRIELCDIFCRGASRMTPSNTERSPNRAVGHSRGVCLAGFGSDHPSAGVEGFWGGSPLVSTPGDIPTSRVDLETPMPVWILILEFGVMMLSCIFCVYVGDGFDLSAACAREASYSRRTARYAG